MAKLNPRAVIDRGRRSDCYDGDETNGDERNGEIESDDHDGRDGPTYAETGSV